MFNRSITLTFPKKKAHHDDQPDTTTDYTVIATDLGKKVVIGAVIIMAAYFAGDTVRQVTVNNLSPK